MRKKRERVEKEEETFKRQQVSPSRQEKIFHLLPSGRKTVKNSQVSHQFLIDTSLINKKNQQKRKKIKMKTKISILILASLTLCTNGRLLLRHKRQLEVEGDPQPNSPTNDVVVIKDVNNDNGPSYQLIPVDPGTGIPLGTSGLDSDSSGSSGSGGSGSSGTDVVDLDINEDDGTFRLGGRIPSLHFHHTSFADMFRAIQERFDGKSIHGRRPLASRLPDFTTRHLSRVLIEHHILVSRRTNAAAREDAKLSADQRAKGDSIGLPHHKIIPTIFSFRRNGEKDGGKFRTLD